MRLLPGSRRATLTILVSKQVLPVQRTAQMVLNDEGFFGLCNAPGMLFILLEDGRKWYWKLLVMVH